VKGLPTKPDALLELPAMSATTHGGAADLTQEHGSNASLLEVLTGRESQIARLVGEGLSNKEVARQLDVSTGTVKVHLHRIYQKLAIRNRTMLALTMLALLATHES